MRSFEVSPLKGVQPILLGMSRAESRQRMNSPFESYEKTPGQPVDAYLDSAFQVFFDSSGAVEYIELSKCTDFSARLLGRNVFAVPAQELILQLSSETDLESDDGGYSFLSHELSLSLWRPVLPASLQDEDGRFFETVGVGVRGYYASAT